MHYSRKTEVSVNAGDLSLGSLMRETRVGFVYVMVGVADVRSDVR